MYPTAEHAYQGAKVNDPSVKTRIKNCATPAEAKDLFEKNIIQPDHGWTVEKKLRIMEEVLTIKFGGKEPLLTRALLDTGDTPLIEGNNWNDNFWGVCKNVGENNLGKILMKIRSALFQQKEHILSQLALKQDNVAVAAALAITQRCLYERMIAFKITNKEYWIS